MSDFRTVMEAAGLRPGDVLPDGRWRRCSTDSKPRKRNGAYLLAVDGTRGWFKDYATDLDWNVWQGDDVRSAVRRIADEQREHRLQARERGRRQRAIANARAYWAAARPLVGAHPYLANKGLSAVGCGGLRIDRGLLVVPVRIGDALVSVQTIAPDGEKRFWTGAPVKGGAHVLERPRSALLCVVEGLATGLAVFQAVRQASVIVAFDAGNLLPVVERLRPAGNVVICADNDHRTAARIGVNPGIEKARNVVDLIGCGVAYPIGIEGSDWADALKEWGPGAAKRIEREVLAASCFVAPSGGHGSALTRREEVTHGKRT